MREFRVETIYHQGDEQEVTTFLAATLDDAVQAARRWLSELGRDENTPIAIHEFDADGFYYPMRRKVFAGGIEIG